MKILVVEDEPLLLNAILSKFKTRSVEAVGCKTSKEALEYLSSDKILPDAIWLDYYLPG